MDTREHVRLNDVAPLPTFQAPGENHSSSHASKQPSIFGLTLDEFEKRCGRSVGSMNFDELISSVCDRAEIQRFFSNHVNLNEPVISNNENGEMDTVVRMPTNYTIPTPFTGKTVDEVLAEIQQNRQQANPCLNFSGNLNKSDTLGTITLEEFLVMAGVVRESRSQPAMTEDLQNYSNSYFKNNGFLDNHPSMGQVMGAYEFSSSPNVASNGNVFMGIGPPCNGLPSGSPFIGSGSIVYPVFTPIQGSCMVQLPPMMENGMGVTTSPSEASGSRGRRKNCSTMEAAAERRYLRMIKNRESAARSRARKQAYTAELEAEVDKLKAENERLKLALAEYEDRRT